MSLQPRKDRAVPLLLSLGCEVPVLKKVGLSRKTRGEYTLSLLASSATRHPSGENSSLSAV